MFFTYPTASDWASLEKNYDFGRLFAALEALEALGAIECVPKLSIEGWF